MPTQRHFDQLATPLSWQSPLAVVAHIDLDAFYAQCQGVYANLPPDEPLACRQWGNVIAVNYPARRFGIKRSMTVDECRQRCPEIHLPHVPTFAKGQREWRIEEDPAVDTHKVSLDFFRRESRKIFKVFRQRFRVVEKAGIDEGFVDLGPQVHARARELFPELRADPAHGAGADAELPPLPAALPTEWFGVLGSGAAAADYAPQSWHDVLLALASKLVWDARMHIHAELRYTCSAGVASTKLTAKLGSARNKPFNQTIVPQTLVDDFLAAADLRDVWGWGGKLGVEVEAALGLPETGQMGRIREFSLRDLQAKLGVDTAQSLYKMVRGTQQSEIQSRTVIKSMASVKNFRKLLKTPQDVHEWVVVYCADLAGRLVDIEEDEGLAVRPRVASVQYYVEQARHSKQIQVPQLLGVAREKLYDALYPIMVGLVDEYVPLPCRYLALELSKIEKSTGAQANFFKPVSPQKHRAEREELFACDKCSKRLPITSRQEHEDHHFALELQRAERSHERSDSSSAGAGAGTGVGASASSRETTPTARSASTSPKKRRLGAAARDPNQGSLDLFLKKKRP